LPLARWDGIVGQGHRRDNNSAVTEALRERYEHLQNCRGRASAEELLAIACFSYALAKITGEPLLFKGKHFKKTDITSPL
jgi:uncharacterized protein with PIN domain